jgi:hypothetical protein
MHRISRRERIVLRMGPCGSLFQRWSRTSDETMQNKVNLYSGNSVSCLALEGLLVLALMPCIHGLYVAWALSFTGLRLFDRDVFSRDRVCRYAGCYIFALFRA